MSLWKRAEASASPTDTAEDIRAFIRSATGKALLATADPSGSFDQLLNRRKRSSAGPIRLFREVAVNLDGIDTPWIIVQLDSA